MGRVITLGTLIAVYMSTSDEMLPILISAEVAPSTIPEASGRQGGDRYAVRLCRRAALGRIFKKAEPGSRNTNIHRPAAVRRRGCGGGAAHAEGLFFIFLISLAIGTVIRFIGEESLSALFSDIPVLGEAAAGLWD